MDFGDEVYRMFIQHKQGSFDDLGLDQGQLTQCTRKNCEIPDLVSDKINSKMKNFNERFSTRTSFFEAYIKKI